jgi:hypothetical protein
VTINAKNPYRGNKENEDFCRACQRIGLSNKVKSKKEKVKKQIVPDLPKKTAFYLNFWLLFSRQQSPLITS